MISSCTACRQPITGISPDVKVCGLDRDVMHLQCAIRVMGLRAFTFPAAHRIEAWKRSSKR